MGLSKDSGLNVLEKAKIQYLVDNERKSDPTTPRYSIDYRQKPEGIRNYTLMEARVKNESLEGGQEWEVLLIPEDDEKAKDYLNQPFEDKKLSEDSSKNLL